jgi:hypothetical protein
VSIEQSNEIHLVRRILRAIAPEFRLLASSNLQAGESVLDAEAKTIEVGEATPIMEAVAAMLFQIGHLCLRNDPEFELLFGVGVAQWKFTEAELIDTLADLGQRADSNAARWAGEVLQDYWPVTSTRAKELMERQCWGRTEWREYFSAA